MKIKNPNELEFLLTGGAIAFSCSGDPDSNPPEPPPTYSVDAATNVITLDEGCIQETINEIAGDSAYKSALWVPTEDPKQITIDVYIDILFLSQNLTFNAKWADSGFEFVCEDL